MLILVINLITFIDKAWTPQTFKLCHEIKKKVFSLPEKNPTKSDLISLHDPSAAEPVMFTEN